MIFYSWRKLFLFSFHSFANKIVFQITFFQTNSTGFIWNGKRKNLSKKKNRTTATICRQTDINLVNAQRTNNINTSIIHGATKPSKCRFSFRLFHIEPSTISIYHFVFLFHLFMKCDKLGKKRIWKTHTLTSLFTRSTFSSILYSMMTMYLCVRSFMCFIWWQFKSKSCGALQQQQQQ